MKTEILKIKGDWQEVVDDCRSTVGKPPLGHEPSEKFKRDILIAEHSPIRDISIKWIWRGIWSYIATHWSRHKWECFIKSQRSDRTGVRRNKLPQDAPVDFTGEANAQNLIDTQRKRLCYTADPDTRKYAEDLKRTAMQLKGYEQLGWVMVPNCIYRCGCPEMSRCGFWHDLKARTNGAILTDSIQDRYDLYNALFREAHHGEAE